MSIASLKITVQADTHGAIEDGKIGVIRRTAALWLIALAQRLLWSRIDITFTALALLLCATPAFAQFQPVNVRPVNSTGAPVADDVVDGSPIGGGPPSLPIGCHAEQTLVSVAEDDKSDISCDLDGVQWVKLFPATTNGLSVFRSVDLGAAGVIKASPGQVYAAWVTNRAATTRWIKFYNATSCTLGTGTPFITIGIPGNATDNIAGALTAGGQGITFSTGICMGATTGFADADTGAPSANDVIINLFYK